MENSIKTSYTVWLQQYCSRSKDKIAQGLIDKISRTTTITGLIDLFSLYLEPEMTKYETIALYSRISTWKNELEKIVSALPEAITKIKKLEITLENQNIILLLKEILSDQNLLLHIRMPSLLHTLSNKKLPDLIEYIVHLPKAPLPSSPPQGSFAALEPKCPKHEACLALLNNLAAAVDTKHHLWDSANVLLQTSLLIYQDLELVEISLEDEPISTKTTKVSNKGGCTLM